MFRSRKSPYSSHRRDYKFLGEGGGGGGLKKCMKFHWHCQRGRGDLIKTKSFRGGNMDIYGATQFQKICSSQY